MRQCAAACAALTSTTPIAGPCCSVRNLVVRGDLLDTRLMFFAHWVLDLLLEREDLSSVRVRACLLGWQWLAAVSAHCDSATAPHLWLTNAANCHPRIDHTCDPHHRRSSTGGRGAIPCAAAICPARYDGGVSPQSGAR